MHKITRAFTARPDAHLAYMVVTCLIPEPNPETKFAPTIRIELHDNGGAPVDPATMETVRVALGNALGLGFSDRRSLEGYFGETFSLAEGAEANDIVNALLPRNPRDEVALRQRFYLPAAA